MTLLILAGCATNGPVKPETKVEKTPETAAPIPLVVPLQEGRQGFVINEVAKMDDASRRDFESAVAMLKEEEYDKAIELLKRVIEQSPGVSAPYINLGMAYQHIGKPEEAETQFKAALQMIAVHPVASNQYGLLLRKSGRFDEARNIYEQALERFPDYYPLHRNLGILCDLYLNDLECALTHYEAYSQDMSEDDKVKLWIADVRNRLGTN
jgi:tetratricopeptide (TPR) repeat protein